MLVARALPAGLGASSKMYTLFPDGPLRSSHARVPKRRADVSEVSRAAGHLDRRRAVGQVHRIGHRDEHFARSREALPPVRGADVVHQHQVTTLPPLACGVFLVHLIDQLYDIRADRVAVAKARIERQPVLAVDVDEVLAQLRLHRPLVQECELVEPASPAGARMTHDGAAALLGAQPSVGLPLELDRVRTAVTLDSATVVGAECFSDGRSDVLVVIADQEPAVPLTTRSTRLQSSGAGARRPPSRSSDCQAAERPL